MEVLALALVLLGAVGVVVVDGAVDIDANKIKAEVGKINPFLI